MRIKDINIGKVRESPAFEPLRYSNLKQPKS